MTGDMTGLRRFRSQVGIGSEAHCLLADRFNNWLTSIVVTGRKAFSTPVTGRVEMTGGVAVEVERRIVSIFWAK